MWHIGIDPGSKGFMCAFSDVGQKLWIQLSETDKFIGFMREHADDCTVAIEDVHALMNSSAKSTFGFGWNVGYLYGVFATLGIRHTPVPPKKWQAAIWTGKDKVHITKAGKKKLDTKSTSFNAARRLFPTVDFRKTPRSVKWDDNKVDSTLICEYCRRMNL